MRNAFMCTALLAFIAASAALAEEPAPATQPAQNDLTIVTYDISGLLRNQADYPLSTSSLPFVQGQAGSSGGGAAASPRPTPSGDNLGLLPANAVTADSLLALIKQMLPDANVAILGNMAVLQAPKNEQAQMLALLNSMHQQEAAGSMMVCSRAFWLSLSPAEVESIFAKVKSNGNIAPMPEVPDSLIDASHLYCEAQTICFSGQTIHVVSGRSQSYVSSVTPIVGNNSVGYSPQIDNALSGVTVQLRPQLIPDWLAVVDVASMVNESSAQSRKYDISLATGIQPTSQPTGEQSPPVIETPNVVQQEFHTTVRLPLGKKILIGGMTLEPAAKDQAGRQLFLAMEVDAVQ